MGQVYWGCYDCSAKTARLVGEESVLDPQAVSLVDDARHWVGVGTGWDEYESALNQATESSVLRHFGERRPEAQDVLRLALVDFAAGNTLRPEEALPVYLRDKVAKTTRERLAEGGKR